MFLRNVFTQFFIAECFKKSLFFRAIKSSQLLVKPTFISFAHHAGYYSVRENKI